MTDGNDDALTKSELLVEAIKKALVEIDYAIQYYLPPNDDWSLKKAQNILITALNKEQK